MDLHGSVALVTGATSGIGKATVRALSRRGAHVLVAGRDVTRGRAVVESIRESAGKADFIASDLQDAESARDLARCAVEVAGRVDVLVNNAGIFPFGPTAEMSEADIDRVYALNVKVPFVLVGQLAPQMAKRGRGAIVNVSSMVSTFGLPGMALYGSSKSALNLLTKAWAAEFGRNGVRVNEVLPGPTRTEGTEVMGEGLDQIAALAPAGRVASPAEIAAAITYLASEDASFLHGVILPVDGGRTAV
jgi:NAD(P)-dependent dehydrogenase (short-subunit alcohol dehydrogenase family)